MEFKKIHLGQLVKRQVEAQGKNADWVMDVLNVSERTVRNLYREQDISMERLRKISQGLGIDLFIQVLSAETQNILQGLTSPAKDVDDAIGKLNERMNAMEKEIRALKSGK